MFLRTIFERMPHRHKVAAVVDIQSGNVCVAIVRLHHDGKPSQVLIEERRVIPSSANSGHTKDTIISGVALAIRETGEKALNNYRQRYSSRYGSVTACHAVVGSPFCDSRVLVTETSYKQPTYITRETIASLARALLSNSTDIAKDDLKNDLIEGGVVLVELNGYPTSRPQGKKTSSVQLTLIASNIQKKTKQEFTARLEQLFGVSPVLHSRLRSVLAGADAFGRGSPKDEAPWATEEGNRCSVIDIGSSVSHIIRLHQGVPDRIESFDVGSQEGRSEQRLLKEFGERMAVFADSEYLPPHLILFAPESLAEMYANVFSRIDLMQFTSTNEPFTVHSLQVGDLAQSVVAHEETDGAEKPDLSLHAACAVALVHSEYQRDRAASVV